MGTRTAINHTTDDTILPGMSSTYAHLTRIRNTDPGNIAACSQCQSHMHTTLTCLVFPLYKTRLFHVVRTGLLFSGSELSALFLDHEALSVSGPLAFLTRCRFGICDLPDFAGQESDKCANCAQSIYHRGRLHRQHSYQEIFFSSAL